MSNLITDEIAAARLQTACALHEFGVTVKLQQLKRAHPRASEKKLQKLLLQWLGHFGGSPPPAPGLRRRAPRKFRP